MSGSTILAALLASSSTLAAPPDCSAETAVEPGRWVVEPTADGFRRELMVRRGAESGWSSLEVMTYAPLEPVADLAAVPPQRPGPFHRPDACTVEAFRAMDYTLGHWLDEEWVREGDRWVPATTSEVSVRPIIGGCAILEAHPIYEGGAVVDRLLLLRGYDAAADAWRQFVFGHEGGVWEWKIERVERGWLLTPTGAEMAGRLRILERPAGADPDFTKTIETLADDGEWRVARVIRYVPW